MKWLNKQNYFVKYLICISLFFILLTILRLTIINDGDLPSNDNSIYVKNNISTDDEKYHINVYYPKFLNSDINKIVTNWVYTYIKNFKNDSKDMDAKTNLEINYLIYFTQDHVNIFFDISNSINLKDINKSILIDLNKDKSSQITELYNEEILKEQLKMAKIKYPLFVSDVILGEDMNSFNYLINDKGFTVYFTNLTYSKEISYIPSLKVLEGDFVLEEKVIDENKKMVALTFDDGPSGQTLEILKCLELNDAKGTFFELGINMKRYKDITKRLYDNGMEIGNHTYSHKYLTKLKLSKALEEINSTSILYNQITGDNITLLRVPYGSINSTIRQNSPLPIISWSIDTKDWLYRDPEKSAPIVLNHVKDGDIILMHDMYESTTELVKIIVPELKARGYELLTVSELARYKNYQLQPGVVVKEMN